VTTRKPHPRLKNLNRDSATILIDSNTKYTSFKPNNPQIPALRWQTNIRRFFFPPSFRRGFSYATGAGATIRHSILTFKIPEHQNTFLFGELCFVWAFCLNQLGEITLVKVKDRTTFVSKTF
jgi:hypothetical protein